MAGASLMPDYYKSRINLAVLLAPPASMYYALKDNPKKALHTIAKKSTLEFFTGALNTIKFWNIVPFNYKTSKAV